MDCSKFGGDVGKSCPQGELQPCFTILAHFLQLQEAVLLALAALAKDNSAVAAALVENEVLTSVIDISMRSKIPTMQLAA